MSKIEHQIPEGYEARIEGNKVILEPKESEDEKIRKAIIEFFESQDDNTTYSFVPKRDIFAWLEKKGKQNSIWSKEDEEMLRRCISATFDHGYLKECDWLKSFFERYAWKPSNEQIETLEHFVRSLGESGYVSPYDHSTKVVYSLLDDLKKLKE